MRLFSTEQVSKYHPDKYADQISDAVLVYLHKGTYVGLRTKRRSEQRELTDEEQKWLLLSLLKRIRDMDYKKYQEWLQRAERGANSWR